MLRALKNRIIPANYWNRVLICGVGGVAVGAAVHASAGDGLEKTRVRIFCTVSLLSSDLGREQELAFFMPLVAADL